jgi:hypothetical protein
MTTLRARKARRLVIVASRPLINPAGNLPAINCHLYRGISDYEGCRDVYRTNRKPLAFDLHFQPH